MAQDIETIAIAALFGPPSPARDRTDARILAAASGIGFMAISDFPGDAWLTPEKRAQLLRIFALPDAEKQNDCCAGISTGRKRTSIAAGSRCSPPPSPTRKAST